MLSSSTEDRQNRCRKVFRFCGCQSGWAPKLNLVVAEIKFVYTHLFNVYMEDMAYFNPGYKVNACFTVRLMIHNHLQNYQEGRVSKTLSCILRYKYIHLGRVGLDGNSQAEENLLARGCQDFLQRYITLPKLLPWSLGGSFPSLQTLVPAYVPTEF